MEDAMAALDNMHQSELMGKVLSCTIAKPTVATRTKPVWEDESYMKEIELDRQVEEEAHGAKDKITESEVVVHNPKKKKLDNAHLPPGMVRCKSCGGWGKDLVQAHGFCNYC